jgi:TRAP-type C4-dicarboxylate transport system permease small subunit
MQPDRETDRSCMPSKPYKAVGFIAQHAMTVAGWAYLGITALICFDILARRWLGFSSGSTTELSGYLMAGAMTWGMAGTLLDRGHVRIDVLVQRLPLKLRIWLHIVSLALLLLTVGFFAWGATSLATYSWELRAADLSALAVPLAIPQGIWAAGLIMFFVTALFLAIRSLWLIIKGNGALADSLLMARTYVDEAQETLQAVGAAPHQPSSKD